MAKAVAADHPEFNVLCVYSAACAGVLLILFRPSSQLCGDILRRRRLCRLCDCRRVFIYSALTDADSFDHTFAVGFYTGTCHMRAYIRASKLRPERTRMVLRLLAESGYELQAGHVYRCSRRYNVRRRIL
jgi:hypothetical protein